MLDPNSKILLATQSINFMASAIEGLRSDCRIVDDEISRRTYEDCTKKLEEVIEELIPVVEEMGEFLNGRDAVSELDQFITTPAMEILLLKKDER